MLPPSPLAERFQIILVEPQNSLNVGSVARAMMNLGFNALHLVNPFEFNPEKALVTGRWAEPIIRSAQFHSSIEDALETMDDVVGFSSHRRPQKGDPLPLPDWCAQLAGGPARRTALLFGREDTGLPNEALERCRLLVRIPSSEEYPSFNLAQSVLLVMYQLSQMQWGEIVRSEHELPSWNQYEQLDRIVYEVMCRSGFQKAGADNPIPGLMKTLFRRMQMNEREMRVILAMFNRIRLTLEREAAPSDSSAVAEPNEKT